MREGIPRRLVFTLVLVLTLLASMSFTSMTFAAATTHPGAEQPAPLSVANSLGAVDGPTGHFGFSRVLNQQVATPTATLTPVPPLTPTATPTATPTLTPTLTPTPAATLTPTLTPTATPTPTLTPIPTVPPLVPPVPLPPPNVAPLLPPPPPIFLPPPPSPLLPAPPMAAPPAVLPDVPVIPETDSLFLLVGGLVAIGGVVGVRSLRRRRDDGS